MKDEEETTNINKTKEDNKNKEEDTHKLIDNFNNNNNSKKGPKSSSVSGANNLKKMNDFNGADEFQKKEINKIIRSKYSSQLLSFTDGLAEFSHLAISYYFKDNLKLSPSKSSFFRSLISFPFIFQPLFGLISDLCPIFGYKRKAYLIIGEIGRAHV